jgi:hypothetical protein
VVLGAGPAADAAAAALRAVSVEVACVPADSAPPSFDPDDDRWRIDGDGRELRPRVLVVAPGSAGEDSYLGVVAAGRANLFFVETPQQAEYVAKCVALLRDSGATRIEMRASVQREFNRRCRAGAGADERRAQALRAPKPVHFDLTTVDDRAPATEYRGPAVLTTATAAQPVEVTLSGHRDPIDGRYHWYGRVNPVDHAPLPDPGRAPVTLALPDRDPRPGTLVERDPWGSLRIVGFGTPPFPLTD